MKEDETLFPLRSGGADSSSSSSSTSSSACSGLLTHSELQQVLDLWPTRGAAAVWEGRAFTLLDLGGEQDTRTDPICCLSEVSWFPYIIYRLI